MGLTVGSKRHALIYVNLFNVLLWFYFIFSMCYFSRKFKKSGALHSSVKITLRIPSVSKKIHSNKDHSLLTLCFVMLIHTRYCVCSLVYQCLD